MTDSSGPASLEAERDDFAEETTIGVPAADGRFSAFLGLLEKHSPLQLRLIGGPSLNHSLLAPTDATFSALFRGAVGDNACRERGLQQS